MSTYKDRENELIGARVTGFLTQQNAYEKGVDKDLVEHIQKDTELQDAFAEGAASGAEHDKLTKP